MYIFKSAFGCNFFTYFVCKSALAFDLNVFAIEFMVQILNEALLIFTQTSVTPLQSKPGGKQAVQQKTTSA